jgi:hypothetical protein
MFDRLDQIDWGRIQACYGTAEQIPNYIRAMASSETDDEARVEAQRDLSSEIWHQGTVYEATALVVPFLIELLANSASVDRVGLLEDLFLAATGNGYCEVHGRLDFFQNERMHPSYEETLAREQREVRAAFDAVAAGIEVYLQLLEDPDSKVRTYAANLLPLCVGQRSDITQRLELQIENDPVVIVRAKMVTALVDCWIEPGFRPVTSTLSDEQRRYLFRLAKTDSQPLAVRFSATCSLMQQGQPEILNEALRLFRMAIDASQQVPLDEDQMYLPVVTTAMISSALMDDREIIDQLFRIPGHSDQSQ